MTQHDTRKRSRKGICPVSGRACEDYRDCHRRNWCWLKSRDEDDGKRRPAAER
ncbi:MAG TPA: hypothetical protein VMY39_09765 [Planctomycetota bacterium]|nr:hypothetical protein [Planctomycetota bacterium]HUV39889.1 hypothetical protein [Planctomycetota bacterium]